LKASGSLPVLTTSNVVVQNLREQIESDLQVVVRVHAVEDIIGVAKLRFDSVEFCVPQSSIAFGQED
jgi:Na+-translocating ferredoxin:NAD+ oxidoreductase RnfE subunit